MLRSAASSSPSRYGHGFSVAHLPLLLLTGLVDLQEINSRWTSAELVTVLETACLKVVKFRVLSDQFYRSSEQQEKNTASSSKISNKNLVRVEAEEYTHMERTWQSILLMILNK
ncbi:hypothetical protein VPH35_001762 [Triticum aestivum]